MSNIKPIKLYSHAAGPNPYKVAIILEELKLPYHAEYLDMAKVKQEPYISVNPNGRVPTIEDPNTGVTIWESAAIIEYLIETYDKQNTLNYTQSPQKWLQSSFKHFQSSGQGPYFGQWAWFGNFHPEKIPSAIERYDKEIKRVIGVLDAHLVKTKQPYLVGEKVSYADLMFVPWNVLVTGYNPALKDEWETKYPTSWAWHSKLLERPGVKAATEKRAAKMAEGN